jgi:hypothetical protein
MRDKPWAAVPLLDSEAPTLWFATELEALQATVGQAYSIQYRPGRKPKVKPKALGNLGRKALTPYRG